MTVQITIIGLGQIGTSIGLALAERKDSLYRVGHDRDFSIAKRAQKMGALDKTMINIPAAVEDADLVVLSLPMDQIRETLSVVAPELKAGAVVMDTGPAKSAMIAWAQEMLPEERYYVGLTPVLNPEHLHSVAGGVEAAKADLFHGGLMGIVSARGVPSEAIKLAVDLTGLLGAELMFSDPLEIDGLMTTVHILPQLMAAALLNITVDQPGWWESRKVAGKPYAMIASVIDQPYSPESLSVEAKLNRESVMRVIDGLIMGLHAIREDVEEQEGDQLAKLLESAQAGYREWWRQRLTSEWVGEGTQEFEAPGAAEYFGQMLGIRRRKKEDN
jgi:prephenate dehydrogenase